MNQIRKPIAIVLLTLILSCQTTKAAAAVLATADSLRLSEPEQQDLKQANLENQQSRANEMIARNNQITNAQKQEEIAQANQAEQERLNQLPSITVTDYYGEAEDHNVCNSAYSYLCGEIGWYYSFGIDREIATYNNKPLVVIPSDQANAMGLTSFEKTRLYGGEHSTLLVNGVECILLDTHSMADGAEYGEVGLILK